MKLLFLLCAMYVSALGAANFERVDLTTINPSALCNDGSPATYFFRAGSGSGSGIWTIYLEGGGFCFDKASCEGRWSSTKHFMSSTQLPEILNDTTISPDVNHGGINSGDETVNPHFYNANQAYVWYCSSDMHAGNNQSIDGWYFNGHVIVQSVVEHLVKVQGMAQQGKQILLTGFSAGGFGVFNNADFVGDMISQMVPGATYKAYVDSGWFLDMPNFDENSAPNRDAVELAYSNFNLQLDQNCAAVYAPSGMQYRCVFADDVLPFIASDLFVAGYQYDMPFIGVSPPFTDTTGEFAEVSRTTFLMQASTLPFFFSPNCYCHGVEAYDTRWNVIRINNQSASDSVWSWFSGTAGSTLRNIDTCSGFQCNPTCSCIW